MVINLIVCITAVFADINGNQVSELESLYQQAQYQQVIDKVNLVFQSQKNIAESTLVRLYTYQAFSYVALNNRDAALNTFRYLLIINPNLQLDPRYVSPKIIEIFEESKRIKGDSLRIKPVYVPFQSSAVNARHERQRAIRSLLYPGLGQLYDNKKTVGYLFLSAETISLIGLVASHFLTQTAHKKYLDNQDLSKMDDLYNKYAFWHQMRIGLCISSISIWIINYINATI